MNNLDHILLAQRNGFLATVENGKPKIRPFEIQLIPDSQFKYYLCTANTKQVYKQLQDNPYVEFSLSTPDNVILRIGGKIKFDDSLSIKNWIIETNDLVRSIYKKGDNPIFEIFYFEEADGSLLYLDGSKPEFFSLKNKTRT
ncbi:pyridoxamine 5'-phosphate oxidase family protein [Niallia circulans]|uniref:pyridoxamine 5'-phosphate oxidase family protein n=1 Tax=Niallia circulans TaxID=1397 RepID=UPI001560C4BB|nr:pyridoxamine 5'-phosphate oxidase family protein [Niallia circulans]NRG33035.1 pyridoxamine 5'-phosphate oxidase family protein [Niallia circulans]